MSNVLAMRGESLAVIYIMVLVLEAVVTLVISVARLGESASAARLAAIALVVAGIALLRSGKQA